MNSIGSAVTPSLLSGYNKKIKRDKPTGVELLVYRYAHDLDLWTGEPLHDKNTSVCKNSDSTEEIE